MDADIPLTNPFGYPLCGFRVLFKEEPTAMIKCIYGSNWIIGDDDSYCSLTPREREDIQRWYGSPYNDQKEVTFGLGDERRLYF